MSAADEAGTALAGRRCLVTGAPGFIGRALCARLAARGAEVPGLVRRAQVGGATNREVLADVADLGQVRAAVHDCRPEVVFHLASRVTGARDLKEVLPTLQANLLGFVHVALAAAELGCERVVCMGSLQEPDQVLPPVPPSPYAAAKFAASAYGRTFAAVFGIPIVIARPMMEYGPGQTDLTKLVPYVLSRLVQKQVAQLSSGQQRFDWVYLDDVCDALMSISTARNLDGLTVDVGTGVLTSVADVAMELALRLDAAEALSFGAIEDRRGEPTRPAEVAKATELIGWRAQVGLEDGLDRTVGWFKDWFSRPGKSGATV